MLLCHLSLLAARHSFAFTACHIPGKSNAIADAISRFQFQHFHDLSPYASPVATPVPPLVLAQLTKSANFISPMVRLLQSDGCIVQRSVSSLISVQAPSPNLSAMARRSLWLGVGAHGRVVLLCQSSRHYFNLGTGCQ